MTWGSFIAYSALIISIVSALNGWFVLPYRVDRLEHREAANEKDIREIREIIIRVDERLALFIGAQQ